MRFFVGPQPISAFIDVARWRPVMSFDTRHAAWPRGNCRLNYGSAPELMIAEDVLSTSPANSLFLVGCVAFPLDVTRPEPITLRDGKLLHVGFLQTSRNLTRLVDFAEHLFEFCEARP